jgi:hypothetical protein
MLRPRISVFPARAMRATAESCDRAGIASGARYAEAMGGTLSLELTGPSGSVFLLRLPLSR